LAVSPLTTYRVLTAVGLIQTWNAKLYKKGMGFAQPLVPHQNLLVDVSSINVTGTFHYFCSLPDGCSSFFRFHSAIGSNNPLGMLLTKKRPFLLPASKDPLKARLQRNIQRENQHARTLKLNSLLPIDAEQIQKSVSLVNSIACRKNNAVY
jgi:hypothetical protein